MNFLSFRIDAQMSFECGFTQSLFQSWAAGSTQKVLQLLHLRHGVKRPEVQNREWQDLPRAAVPRFGLDQHPYPWASSGNCQTLQGSFSAVSKPNFASKYAFESSRRDLHNALLSTAPKSHYFQNLPKFAKIFRNFAKFAIFKTDFLRKF